MRQIKFTTAYEQILSFDDKDFKIKYEERIGNNPGYTQTINGVRKHLALCPLCNNPVTILGIYKKINETPHARHDATISEIPYVTVFDKYKLERCPYYKRNADYVKEYVPETEEPQRRELYRIAKENYDKAIYLLQKQIGIHMSKQMIEKLAENYVMERAYNYIDATIYNIPWYLIYCFPGFLLYRLLIKKGCKLYKCLKHLGFSLENSKNKEYVFVKDNNGYLLKVTNYRYSVNKEEKINEWVDFSIVAPDNSVENTLLYKPVDRFSIQTDSYYFNNLINFTKWNKRQELLDIADKYMKP